MQKDDVTTLRKSLVSIIAGEVEEGYRTQRIGDPYVSMTKARNGRWVRNTWRENIESMPRGSSAMYPNVSPSGFAIQATQGYGQFASSLYHCFFSQITYLLDCSKPAKMLSISICLRVHTALRN